MGNGEKDGKSVLLEIVTKAKAWLALADLKTTSMPSERSGILVKAFREACAHHDDENALQLFTWLLQAIAEEGDPSLEQAGATDWKADEVAKARLVCRQADATKALYPEIPIFRLGPPRYVGESETRSSTLLKTKKAMLEAIAGGWRSASTDKTADEFFMFIYKIDSGLHDGLGDGELINETIRRVVGSDFFPLARLMYTLRNHPDLYTDILAHAWVKNGYYYKTRHPLGSGSKVGLILAAIGGFYEASPEATKLLGCVSAKIIAVDHQLRNLNNERRGLTFGPPNLEFEHKKDDDGNPRLDEVLVHFKVTVFEEKEFHQQFELTRDRIIEAKKGWTVPIRIKLRGEFTFRYKHQITLPRTEDI